MDMSSVLELFFQKVGVYENKYCIFKKWVTCCCTFFLGTSLVNVLDLSVLKF